MNAKLIDAIDLTHADLNHMAQSQLLDAGLQARQPFHLIIKPIGPVCNLDCDYCFYLDKEQLYPSRHSFRMKDETLKSLIQQYIQAQPLGTKTVHFAWQGGEPTLMGLEFFKQAIRYQQMFAREGMEITNAMQTNGTLLNDDWGAFLKQHNFLIGISVDGPMTLHDKLRKTKTGEGSFNQVKRGVEVLRRHQVEHNFLCVINRLNGDHPEKVYKALKKLGAEHIQFIPIVEHALFDQASHGASFAKNIGNKKAGKSSKQDIKVSKNSVLPLQFGQFLSGVFAEWTKQDVGRVFIRNFEEVLAKILHAPSSMCVHAPECGRNLAVEHDGSVFSCDHFVYPQFKPGNLLQTPLVELVDGAQQSQFGRDKKQNLCSECLQCDYRALCHGGCPAHRIDKQANDKHRLNYLCEGYKHFYKTTGNGMVRIAQTL